MMHACKQVRLSGTIRVPLPPAEAFKLFTPTGERAWVVGWDPLFPADVADETDPGTVFQTQHAGPQTTWIVVRREPREVIEYARVTPSDRAGLVSVACSAEDNGITAVTVSYDLTALTPDANAALDEFAEQYPDFLEHWRQAIEHTMAGSGR
jgi:hypothetical protein